jgi:hypothetical protein
MTGAERQAHYSANVPATAEALRAICDLDLSELQAMLAAARIRA